MQPPQPQGRAPKDWHSPNHAPIRDRAVEVLIPFFKALDGPTALDAARSCEDDVYHDAANLAEYLDPDAADLASRIQALLKGGNKPNDSRGTAEAPKDWHSPNHAPIRDGVVEEIIKLIGRRGPNNGPTMA
jgi:hypothetical protein